MRKQEALELFTRLADYATDPAVVSNAALQAAGLYFELLQPKRWRREEVSADEWAEVRRMCERVKVLGFAKAREIARADLMIMETYLWDHQPQECLARAEAYIASHAYPEYRRELSTARLFAGESLLRLGQPGEALARFRWIANEYETNGEIWTWSYLTARTYYRIYDALIRSGAPQDEVDAAANYVLDNFPDSRSADLIRTALDQQQGQPGP